MGTISIKEIKRIHPWRVLSRIFLYLWTGLTLFAFGFIVINSLKTNNQFFSNPWALFENPVIENYRRVLTEFKLGSNFLNSIYVVLLAVAGLLMVCAPASYVLARMKFPFSDALGKFFIFGMGVPYQLMMVPIFFILIDFGMLDKLTSLAVVYVALSIPFTVFLMMGFFKTLPHELEEAAYMDGCSPIKTFYSVMLPLGRPALVTAGIFNFVYLWNEYLLALCYISDQKKFTLPIGLNGLQGSMQYIGEWTPLLAGCIVVIIPTFIIYLALSRQIIEGLTMGAVKE
jgi:raffinose/stachyose/melibiose transport system permease protein/N-acetylglucosamine transport system permease protein